MPDADGDDSAEAIEIAAAFFVKNILSLAFHQHHRLFVIEENAGIEKFAAELQNFIGGGAGVGFWLMIERRQGRSFHILAIKMPGNDGSALI